MTDRHEEPRDAHDLADAVSDLGETPEDALEEVAGRNASLEEHLPDPMPGVGRSAETSDAEGVSHGEGAPGQG
jgi:hypothetical protein